SYTSRFARLGLRYRAVKGATSVTVMPSVGVDDVNARANHENLDKGMHKTTLPISMRGEVDTAALGGTLAVGVDGGWQRNNYDMINTPPPTPMNPAPDMVIHRSLSRWSADVGAYAEQSWFFANELVEVRPGVRADHFGLSDQWTLDPRI